MKPDDYGQFGEIMHKLGSVFGTEITPIMAEAYFEALETRSIERVEAAAAELIRTNRFMPRPVDLIECDIGTGVTYVNKAYSPEEIRIWLEGRKKNKGDLPE